MKMSILSILFLISMVMTVFGQNSEPMRSGTFTDSRDNHLYKWVKIGTQIWMAENLAFKPSFGALCYGNMLFNCDYYGTLYTYEAAKTACPEGWSLPTDEQWMLLEKAIGIGNEEIVFGGRRGEDQAAKLKSRFGWSSDGNGSDTMAFSILPGGSYYTGFNGIGNTAYFWSSTTKETYIRGRRAWTRSFYNDTNQIGRYLMNQSSYLSVRCIKDN